MAHYHDPELEAVARETLRFIEAGGYMHANGTHVRLEPATRRAIDETTTLTEADTRALLAAYLTPPANTTRVEVTGETTQQAAHRLVVGEGEERIALLNFASATKPGGGFLSGARAQEEDLARCSTLHPCLTSQDVPDGYYDLHRRAKSPLYSDAVIYSPDVPFFRVRSRTCLDHVFPASVVTVAAPNMRRLSETDVANPADVIARTYRERVGALLAVMTAQGHRTVLLGAFGCGVFRCDPEMAARTFAEWLRGTFAGAFDRVVFPVYDPQPGQPLRRAFERHIL